MKIIKHVAPACPCMDKLWELYNERRGTQDELCIGTVVECDCGARYKLAEHQFDGLYWEWHHPDSGNMALR